VADPCYDADLERVLAEVGEHRECRLLPPVGEVAPTQGFSFPADLYRFYELCGGAVLFEGAPFTWKIHGPQQLVAASPRLLGQDLAEETARQDPDELTNTCFVFAESGDSLTDSLIVVDLPLIVSAGITTPSGTAMA
jgi:hypothetical protein